MSFFSHIISEAEAPFRSRQPGPVSTDAGPAPALTPNDPAAPAKDKVELANESEPAEHTSLHEKLSNVGHKALGLIIPADYPNSVSKDYAVTRKWQLARDLAGNIAWGFAAGVAVSAATVPGIAAMGLTLFSYGLIKDRIGQVASLAASTMAPIAARNPRAWLLGGDIIDSVGVAMTSALALAPQLFVPLSIGIGVMQTFAGAMKGAASADITRRQAIADNVPDLNAKNGNQGLIVNNLGLALGGGLSAAMMATFGAATLPIIGTVAAGVGLFATGRMLANLDMNPVNEEAVRKVVDSMAHGDEKIPGPEGKKIWRSLSTLFHSDKIKLGEKDAPLKKDPARFEELSKLYADKKYILDAVDGKPYVVVKQDATPQDRFQAEFQAVTMENLQKSDEFKDVQAKQGDDKARTWLIQQSLSKTPTDVAPLLQKMKDAGWSIDLLRFKDTGVREKPPTAPKAEEAPTADVQEPPKAAA